MSKTRFTAASVLGPALVCCLLIGFSIAFLDRPIATFSHAALKGQPVFLWLTWIVEPVPNLAAGLSAAMLVAVMCGWRPGPVGRIVLACCLASLLALALKDRAKDWFGRTWPETWTNGNPSWIGDGVFTFVPFHGGDGWRSFPSGHTALISAPMSVLICAVPRAKILWAGLVVLVAVGLIGTNFHWLSDILAGGLVGALAGVGVWTLINGHVSRNQA